MPVASQKPPPSGWAPHPPRECFEPNVRAPTPPAFASGDRLAWATLLDAPVRWPRPSRLSEALKLSGRKPAEALSALGVQTRGDLLEHLPRDRREARALAQLRPGEQATVAVEVESIAARPVRRRGMRPLVEATVFDATGAMRAAFFNQPWLVERYRPGTRLLLHGKAQPGGRFAVVSHALGDELAGDEATREIAHYPASVGVSSTQIAALVRAHRGWLADVVEPLPAQLRAAERLPDRAGALAAMHFPRDVEEAEAGRVRLAFEELLLMQLALLRRRTLRGSGAASALAGPGGIAARAQPTPGDIITSAPPVASDPQRGEFMLTARWLEGLPFSLTCDQTAAMAEIDADLAREQPMQRLLMGEVGSGKTVVALYALLRAVEHGMQGALMAPTETLAEQHFATLQTLVPNALLPAALLTGSTPARRRADVLGKLASGELQMVVGTHALIENDVVFQRLAVAVVDEQHRFGVRQRAALDRKGPPISARDVLPTALSTAAPSAAALSTTARVTPHVLHMTATPIPRTLALTEYGDLDVTHLRELPRGRRPIATHIAAGERARARAYERIREELRAGRQAYVVCPLVEESEDRSRGMLASDRSRETRAFGAGRFGDASEASVPLIGPRFDQHPRFGRLADRSSASDRRSAGQSSASDRQSTDRSSASDRQSADRSSAYDRGSARAATAELERLRASELRDFRLELLHGQLRPAQKREAMARFAAGEVDVLVATTVIEVGIDVPNATVMLVENAERYGISQLHQLRGRIGRGEHPSVCLLLGPRGARRLQALAEHSDGFELAEIDLRLRGEGELAGTRQHGLADPSVAVLPQDAELLERARVWAQRLHAADPTLEWPEHAPLRDALERALGADAHEPLRA